MISLFVVLYACYYLSPRFSIEGTWKVKLKHYLQPLWDVFLYSILGVAAASILLVPVFFNLIESKGQAGGAMTFSMAFQINPLDILSKLTIGGFDAQRLEVVGDGLADLVFAQRVESVEGYRAAHQRLARAVLLLGQARERHALAAAQAQRLLGESSFESAELVQTAVRTPERVDALEQAVAAYELEHARLLEGFGREAIVAVAARVAAGEQAPDDLQGVRERVEQLRAAAHRLTLREGERESMLRSLQALRGEYAAFRAKTAQRYDRAQMLANLAAAARGDTLGGYEHQVDLVSYMLGAEFERILHSASLHLDRMSDGRYGMVFSDHRAKGSRSGGGLNLEITDTWTGEPREASSLSGGESFLASLSLALGLAEVVQANNGGIELDTLFIDEGFGTLDAETLDMVMGTIESLRDSGRTIGLISHVEEMKNRIPAQIVVEKGQNGSSVRVNS